MLALSAIFTASSDAAKLAAGSRTSCSVSPTGALTCWGASSLGGLGVGPRTQHSYDPLPVVGLGAGVTDITAGEAFGCAVHNGAAKCWGNGQAGHLGNGTTGLSAISDVPVQVIGLGSGVTRISSTGSHTCAVHAGAAKCWGSGSGLGGRLGYSASESKSQTAPVQVAGMTSGVTDIAAGGRHTCAIQSGVVSCFGDNTNGELGYGGIYGPPTYDITYRYTPKPVRGLPAGRTAVRIAAGGDISCAILDDGSAWCWGFNNVGQLGNGTTGGESIEPTQVIGLSSGVTDISITDTHACAIQAGAAKCWGYNQSGQLGDGSSRGTSATPVAVSGLGAGVTSIAAGNSHSCAVASGQLFCWGSNGNGAGQLGNEAVGSESYVPAPVIGSKPKATPPPVRPRPAPVVPTPTPVVPKLAKATFDVPTKARKVNKKRKTTLASVRCPTGGAACTVTAPTSVTVKIGGKSYKLTVLAGKRINAGKALSIRVRLPKAANKRLKGRTALCRSSSPSRPRAARRLAPCG